MDRPDDSTREQVEEALGYAIDFLTNKTLWTVILILIPLLLAVYFRVYPAYLPQTDAWAEQSITNGLQQQVLQNVRQQYPNLPSQQQQQLAQEQARQVLEQQGQIQQRIDQQSQQLKERLRNENDQTYLLAIDPYQHYRRVDNKVETGHYYDELKNGTPWNTKKTAPLGTSMTGSNLHQDAGYGLHRLVTAFNPDLELMSTFSYLPVLLAALAVIPAFFVARRRGGLVAGLISSTLVAVHSSFLGRSPAGFADTDAWQVLLPLFITWMFIEAFDAHMDRERAVYAAFAATGIGLFSYAWQGWWYIFDFLFAVLIGITMYYLVRAWIQHDYDIRAIWSSERVRDVVVIGFIFVIGSLLTVSLFRNISGFFSGFLEPFRFTIIDQAAKANLWPNVFTTVAELGDTSIASVVNQMGGGGAFAKTIFFIALMAIPLTLTREGEWDWKDWTLVGGSAVFFLLMVSDFMLQMNQIVYLALLGVPVAAGGLMSLTGREADIKYAAVLTVWFIGTMYASTKGMRFMLLLVPAFAVSVGLAVGIIRKRLARSFSDMNSLWINIPTILVVFLLLYNPIVSAHNQASNEIPAMNDAWYQSLEKIDQEAEPDAIVNSWWDFGHWFKAIADRAVTFDGGSQNTPMAHWVGKTLLTGSEEEAIGILRMLDCGSNLAYENVNNVTDDTVRSVNILYDIVTMNESAARDRLDQEGFTPDEINTVMDRTHCEPPENYFITSEDMVGKAGVWAHFGSWSFERAFIYNELVGERPDTAVETIVDKFGYSEDRARSLYFDAQGLQTSDEANAWIAPWPSYQTGSWQSCTQTNQTLECRINARLGQQQGGIVVLESVTADLENPKNSSMSIGLYTQQGQRQGGVGQQMKALGIADNESISTYSFDTSQSNRGILVDDVENRVLMMHPELLNSTFTKLFFMDGRYMDHFNKFSDRTSFNGQNIKIWTVDWPES